MNFRKTIENLTGLEYRYNEKTFKGGYVMEPTGPFYEDVVVLDFKRFYPNIIISHNLFGSNMSLYLKGLLNSSLNDTGEAKKSSKILLNTFYGMMKHFDFDKAEKCAELGRAYLLLAITTFQHEGFKVVSADTDSLTIISQGSDWKINYCINKLQDIIKKSCENYQETFTLEIENRFKYIYYFRNSTGYKKKQYCGVKHDGGIVLKSRRLNKDEQLAFGFIAPVLRIGRNEIDEEEIIPYCEKVFHENKKFINVENITIIGIKRRQVLFGS